MIEEREKQLLLKDLCARLPYGVKCQYYDGNGAYTLLGIDGDELHVDCPVYDEGDGYVDVNNAKPYLRPMSSMTDDENIKYIKACELDTEILSNDPMDGTTPFPILYNSQDYLNSIHVDYRGLIPRGLALEAPEKMYKILK